MTSLFVFLRWTAIAMSLVCCGDALQSPHQPPKSSKAAIGGEDNDHLYKNSEFGFTFRIPFGWVDRTRDLGPSSTKGDPTAGNKGGETRSVTPAEEAPKEQAKVLLGVFERPPEVTSEGVNSAVVIAYESTAAYPGLKKAEDYVGPVGEVAAAQGFKMVGEAYPITVESRMLIRVDFIRSLGKKRQVSDSQSSIPQSEEIMMRQSTLIWLLGKRVVSFTFIAASEEGLDEIMDGLHFSVRKGPH